MDQATCRACISRTTRRASRCCRQVLVARPVECVVGHFLPAALRDDEVSAARELAVVGGREWNCGRHARMARTIEGGAR